MPGWLEVVILLMCASIIVTFLSYRGLGRGRGIHVDKDIS